MAERRRLTTEERIERKKTLAAERNTRVSRADISDTHILIDITNALNRGVKILMNRLGKSVSFEEGFKLLKKLNDLELQANAVAEEICAAVNIPYRIPVGLRKTIIGDAEGSKTEKAIDSKMDMAYAGIGEHGDDGKGDKKVPKKA
jgi:hypothetical protein